MRPIIAMTLACALAGCGVETAGTAATAAAIKKQELEQGKKTMQDAQQKIDAAAKQVEARSAAADSDK
ncbi:MAG TPA: hypothetical protein VFB08_03440 [Burkholderiales bacterium]|nr:hypothetical protein [Burkholderiales bacterium]